MGRERQTDRQTKTETDKQRQKQRMFQKKEEIAFYTTYYIGRGSRKE